MSQSHSFGVNSLTIDLGAEADLIAERLRRYLAATKRKGAVVALSGGIDSSVTAALCVRALGSKRVFGLHMPERASSPETIALSTAISDAFGFDSAVEQISPSLRRWAATAATTRRSNRWCRSTAQVGSRRSSCPA